MSRRILAAVALLTMLAGDAVAQNPVVKVAPNPSHFLVTPLEVQSANDRYSDGIDVVQWWVNLFAEQKLRGGLTSIVSAAVAEATPVVKWTGQTALFEVRVFKAKEGMDGGWFIAQIADGKAIFSGLGATPEQALFANFSDDRWSSGVPDGYEVDPAYSGFFVVREVKGKMRAQLLPKGTIGGLVDRMRDNYGELETKFQTERMNNKDAWVRMGQTAKSQLSSAQAQAKVDSALQAVLASQVKVADINTRMSEAIDRETRSANALVLLNALRTVVDTATLVQTAIAETKVPAKEFENAKTPDAVIQRTTEIHNDSVTIRQSTTIEFNNQKGTLDQALFNFWKSIEPAKPPQQTRDLLKIARPM